MYIEMLPSRPESFISTKIGRFPQTLSNFRRVSDPPLAVSLRDKRLVVPHQRTFMPYIEHLQCGRRRLSSGSCTPLLQSSTSHGGTSSDFCLSFFSGDRRKSAQSLPHPYRDSNDAESNGSTNSRTSTSCAAPDSPADSEPNATSHAKAIRYFHIFPDTVTYEDANTTSYFGSDSTNTLRIHIIAAAESLVAASTGGPDCGTPCWAKCRADGVSGTWPRRNRLARRAEPRCCCPLGYTERVLDGVQQHLLLCRGGREQRGRGGVRLQQGLGGVRQRVRASLFGGDACMLLPQCYECRVARHPPRNRRNRPTSSAFDNN